MDSLRGSSFAGQEHEDMVAAAMQRMGFEVQQNVLLDSNTGQEAGHWLQEQWVRYVCKEFCNGKPQRWLRTFQRLPTWEELCMPRPFVAEVDVLAKRLAPFEEMDSASVVSPRMGLL